MSHVLWWVLITLAVLLAVYLGVWWTATRASRSEHVTPQGKLSQTDQRRVQARRAYAEALSAAAVNAADEGHSEAADVLREHAARLRTSAGEPVIPQPRRAPGVGESGLSIRIVLRRPARTAARARQLM
ncbi:hypothetical protein FPZ12_005725 [Amycolatopsis acidicola]|uniref:Uncharacterized protein n=1 Tax=Amycolatopsis acidicola TaxID=2596893 RepID=A0A5N0VHG0_9PSEU|nr:hypothetical protein [Amycolatopsis acidicola]KAA9165565.1 hypothetical protein FPZ12_005725 [Amycolatopsis acidicola]